MEIQASFFKPNYNDMDFEAAVISILFIWIMALGVISMEHSQIETSLNAKIDSLTAITNNLLITDTTSVRTDNHVTYIQGTDKLGRTISIQFYITE